MATRAADVVPYTIHDHKHRFSAWAAGRAASVNGCRFSVVKAKAIIESVGLKEFLCAPNALPQPSDVDRIHGEWRNRAITAARAYDLVFTHGVAAKLINVYLKAGLVCGGHHADARVRALHPPIDSVLLDELSRQSDVEQRHVWNSARRTRWSNFDSRQYQNIIDAIRDVQRQQPLWAIECHWRGYQ